MSLRGAWKKNPLSETRDIFVSFITNILRPNTLGVYQHHINAFPGPYHDELHGVEMSGVGGGEDTTWNVRRKE